jgi:dephospho-CoA kinase
VWVVVRVGLTGGIGSGKSAVARLLAEHGAVVVDADAIAREVVAPGTPGLAAVLAEFGTGVRAPDGSLDRPALARIVFADGAALGRLNKIVHPLVAARRAELVDAAPPDAVVVDDVPLLAENRLAGAFDLVVVVTAPEAVRVERLRAGRGMTEAAARSRMDAQATDAQRAAIADVLIGNDGSLADLAARVDAVWRDRIAPLAAAQPEQPPKRG